MKRSILFLLSICVLLFSCDSDEDPYLSISKTEFSISDTGGSQSIMIDTNEGWTARSSQAWCTVSPADGGSSVRTAQITAEANDTHNDRSCTVTFTVGSISRTVNITQRQKSGLFVTKNTFNISSNSQIIEVELRTNIEVEVVIPQEAKSWVSYVETRALRTETVMLSIAENESEKMRSAKVQIKDKATDLQETITINQMGNVPGVYWVDRMGTLGTILSQTQKDTITTMVVKGEINKADFEVMKSQMPKLKYIDLKEVKCEGDRIPEYAFGYPDANKNISTIILPESITAIGDQAFYDCSGLTGNLILPDGVTTIEEYAFYMCRGFRGNLILPEGLTTIGSSAFGFCSGFTGNLILPDGLTTIGEYAFANCSGFTGDLILPDGLTEIGSFAFWICSGLTGNLILPDGLTEIGSSAFVGCSGFTGNLILPDGLTTIGEWTFHDCSGFTGDLILPDGLTTIGEYAFQSCSGFTGNLILPDGLTTIGEYAFQRCSGFTGDLILPDGLTTIGEWAFQSCSGFTGNLILPDGLTTIESTAFYGCSGFTGNLILPDGLTTIGEYAFRNCSGFTGNLILPDGLTTIGDQAFYDCSGFTGLTIGKSVSTIHESAFIYCNNITGNVVFPESLISIRNEAFNGCHSVDAFQFPHTTPLTYYTDMLEKSVPVKVPNQAVSTYQSTNGWKDHTIVGY